MSSHGSSCWSPTRRAKNERIRAVLVHSRGARRYHRPRINFILNPVGASTGYGIPNPRPAAFPFMWITGIRDIFAGLVILPFLWRGGPAHNRNTLRYFNFRPVLRWACHSATSWLCAACLYSLGNSAVHDDCCRIFFLEGRNPNYSHSVGDEV